MKKIVIVDRDEDSVMGVLEFDSNFKAEDINNSFQKTKELNPAGWTFEDLIEGLDRDGIEHCFHYTDFMEV